MTRRGSIEKHLGHTSHSARQVVPARGRPSPDDVPAPGLWDHLTHREREAAGTTTPARPSDIRPGFVQRIRPGPTLDDARDAPALQTGLPDRGQFERELQLCAQRADVVHRGCALLIIDLDRFARINDRLGRSGGDRVLAEVADRLRNAIRSVDMAAHLQADVFAVLLAGVTSPDAATGMGRKITAALGLPIEVDDDFVMVTASVGMALYGVDGRSLPSLMEAAEAALARAKRGGGPRTTA